MTGALDGIRVLDFSRLLPGPYCTWLLADMGADVIRIENPRELEKQDRVFGWDRLDPAERARQRQGDILARNKRSVRLDIGSPAALSVLERLARNVDVVVEDYRPGVLDGLGLGYEALRRVNPRLVYCSLSLCGQTGPYRDKPGHDPVALAISGALSRVGENPDAPGFPGIPVADIVTGTHAAFGILAALVARGRDGEGQFVDVAMSDCAMTMLVNVLSRHRDLSQIPARGTRRADMGLWRTADGKFICTTDMEPRYWRKFCEAVGHPEFAPLQHDVNARPRIRATLEATFARRPQREWLTILGQAGTQFAPVNDIADAWTDAHVVARGMALDVAGTDGSPVRQLGQPVKLSRTPGGFRSLARQPGEDTEEILASIGLNAREVAELEREGAFGTLGNRGAAPVV